VNRLAFEHLTIQANHATGLGVKHTRKSHEEYFKNSGFEQSHLIFLGKVGESRNTFCKFNDTTNGRREPLGEVLKKFLLS